ncbi:MAG: hypothetical protein U1F52_06810 [Burkholderiales bacterium]
MNWLNVVLGFVLIFGAVAAWYRIMRNLTGSGGAMKLDLPKRGKRSDIQPNELERIIAAHRSASQPAAAPAAQAMPRAPHLAAVPHEVTAPARAPTTAAPQAGAPAPPPVTPSAGRPLLSGAHRLVYGLFKSVLPEYSVFPGVPLALVVPGTTATGHVLALVVCRPDLSVVAAVDLVAAGAIHPPAVARTLTAAGIRHLAIDPRALPRREAVREFVHGA